MKNINLVQILLRLEGLTAFISAILVYAYLQGEILPFILLLLVPDISMIGYAVNTYLGSIIYNIAHTYTAPILLASIAILTEWHIGALLACIWFAHIGMDRIVGYGLKYPTHFKDTHFSKI